MSPSTKPAPILQSNGAGSGKGAFITLHPFSAKAGANEAHLRIMETTDLHVHVMPYDYYADRPVDTVGLARTAALIKSVRAEAANAMLVDNGDFLQGNPMGDFMAYERGLKAGDVHPIIAAMNTVGFEASTLGNHEFNYGLDFLMKSIAGAEFPVVCANVATKAGTAPTADQTLVPPYTILDKMLTDGAGVAHKVRIGLIGFVPPQIMTWDRRHLEGNVAARDIIEAARAWVPRMKEEGAQIIIALSHSGIGSAQHQEGMENASVPLAAVDGIDALMTGHSHLLFPDPQFEGIPGVDARAGTLHGKPAVMGGFWGSNLGVIDLMLAFEGGEVRVVNAASQVRAIFERGGDNAPIALVESEPEVEQSAASAHAETLAYIRRPVGKSTVPLHSYFALVADDPSVQIVNQAQQWYIAEMMKGTAFEGFPVLSAASPFKAGGRGGPDYYTDVPAGNLAIRNVADLYLYPNTVRAVKITGAQLKGWLERSAGLFNQITPGKPDQDLLNPGFPAFDFDAILGVRYEINLSRPPMFDKDGHVIHPDAGRIVHLTFDGAPVADDMQFIVATNNYRAGGGGNFPGTGDTIIFEGPDTNRDVVVRYISKHGTITPSTQINWRFAPMPGTTVLFNTGPKAADHIGDVKGVTIEPAGDGPDGFARYRISL